MAVIEYVIANPYKGIPQTILFDGHDPYTQGHDRDYYTQSYQIVCAEAFSELHEKFLNNLCGHWQEIDAERYDEMLNVLPPDDWRQGGFYLSERDIGDVAGFYQALDGKYYTSRQRRSTPRKEILAGLQKWIGGRA
jgi:hypothetical protein